MPKKKTATSDTPNTEERVRGLSAKKTGAAKTRKSARATEGGDKRKSTAETKAKTTSKAKTKTKTAAAAKSSAAGKAAAKRTTKNAVATKRRSSKATASGAGTRAAKVSKRAGESATAQKRGARSITPPALTYADDAKSFWTVNGEVLNSLLALRDALKRMDSDSYAYHVRDDQNDFAVWVAEVLGDETCAAELANCPTPSKAKTVIVRRLRSYDT